MVILVDQISQNHHMSLKLWPVTVTSVIASICHKRCTGFTERATCFRLCPVAQLNWQQKACHRHKQQKQQHHGMHRNIFYLPYFVLDYRWEKLIRTHKRPYWIRLPSRLPAGTILKCSSGITGIYLSCRDLGSPACTPIWLHINQQRCMRLSPCACPSEPLYAPKA